MERNASEHSSFPHWEKRGAEQQRYKDARMDAVNVYNSEVADYAWENNRGGAFVGAGGVVLIVPDFPLEEFLETIVTLQVRGKNAYPEFVLYSAAFKNTPAVGTTSTNNQQLKDAIERTSIARGSWNTFANQAKTLNRYTCDQCQFKISGGFLSCPLCYVQHKRRTGTATMVVVV